MENDELRDVLKMDFPDYKVDNEKIISLCKNQKKRYNYSFLKIALYFTILVIIGAGIPFAFYISNNINKTPNVVASDSKVDTSFFVIDGSTIGKSEDPIRIGYRAEDSIFNEGESLEIEVLIGYFGDISNSVLFPADSDLPKIVLRTNDNPIVEYDLVEIENFVENYKLKYIRNEDDNVICGCKYVFPDEAKGIKVSIDSEFFSGMFGERRIGLYVGYMYKAETIYFCRNVENGTICISSISLEDAMKKANYEYVSGQSVE